MMNHGQPRTFLVLRLGGLVVLEISFERDFAFDAFARLFRRSSFFCGSFSCGVGCTVPTHETGPELLANVVTIVPTGLSFQLAVPQSVVLPREGERIVG